MNTLATIFLEAAHHASIVPMASEATIYAMKAFGNSEMQLPVLLAILGGLAGHGFNLFAGRRLMLLPSAPKNERAYLLIQKYFNRYGFILLVFCFLSLGNVLTIIAGLLGTPMKKALPPIAAGLIFSYGRLLFS